MAVDQKTKLVSKARLLFSTDLLLLCSQLFRLLCKCRLTSVNFLPIKIEPLSASPPAGTLPGGFWKLFFAFQKSNLKRKQTQTNAFSLWNGRNK